MTRPAVAMTAGCLAVLLVLLSQAAAEQAYEAGRIPTEAARAPSAVNVSIALFDPNVPEDRLTRREREVFPRIREIESLFLPFVLREVLTDAGGWGVVRVVREPVPSAELQLEVRILESDGERLVLDVLARDATGRTWVKQTYSAETMADYSASAEDAATGHEQLYRTIAADLESVRDALDERALESIVNTSLIRYAYNLVPVAYEDYLDERADGTFGLLRLPARNDPMLGRIERLRTVEHAITDTVDEKYEELHDEIASTYDLWREYRHKYRRYQAEEAERAASEPSNAPAGSYDSLMDRYLRYKWDRQAAQEQQNWAEGFNNEVASTIERIGTRIDELERWVDQEYGTWERILAEFYELEQELAAPQT